MNYLKKVLKRKRLLDKIEIIKSIVKGKIKLAHCRPGQIPLTLHKARRRMGKVIGFYRKGSLSLLREQICQTQERYWPMKPLRGICLCRLAASSFDFWNRLSVLHDTGSSPDRGRGRRVEEALYLPMRSFPSRSLAEGTRFGEGRDFHIRISYLGILVEKTL